MRVEGACGSIGTLVRAGDAEAVAVLPWATVVHVDCFQTLCIGLSLHDDEAQGRPQ